MAESVTLAPLRIQRFKYGKAMHGTGRGKKWKVVAVNSKSLLREMLAVNANISALNLREFLIYLEVLRHIVVHEFIFGARLVIKLGVCKLSERCQRTTILRSQLQCSLQDARQDSFVDSMRYACCVCTLIPKQNKRQIRFIVHIYTFLASSSLYPRRKIVNSGNYERLKLLQSYISITS